jgi:hypothetical protein
MKRNVWTKLLVGAGILSLPAVLVAEEKSSSVMTAVSSTTLSGYVDTSMQWNPGTGNARLPDYKFNSSSKADGFNLDVVQLRIEKPLDEAEWAAGYRVDLWAGPDANVLGTQSVYGNSSFASKGDFAIRQAYVALRTPVGNGLDFKVGVFDSILGYESVEAPANPNYTRSFGHTIEPQTHTGILGTYRFCQCFTASFGVADTIGPTINERAQGPNSSGETKAESFKTYMGSIALTAPDSWGCLSGSTLYGGIVNGFTSSYGENQTAITSARQSARLSRACVSGRRLMRWTFMMKAARPGLRRPMLAGRLPRNSACTAARNTFVIAASRSSSLMTLVRRIRTRSCRSRWICSTTCGKTC